MQALGFGGPFLLLFGSGLAYAMVWSARAPLAAQHRVLTTLSAPLRRLPHPVVRLYKSKLLPFYPSPTFQGPAAGYTWHGSHEGFFGSRLVAPWESAGYYQQRGAKGKMVPSRPSNFGLLVLARNVAVPLALTLASPTSLSPLLVAFSVQLVAFGALLVQQPYAMARENVLAAASLFAVLCTLFYAGILLACEGGGCLSPAWASGWAFHRVDCGGALTLLPAARVMSDGTWMGWSLANGFCCCSTAQRLPRCLARWRRSWQPRSLANMGNRS